MQRVGASGVFFDALYKFVIFYFTYSFRRNISFFLMALFMWDSEV